MGIKNFLSKHRGKILIGGLALSALTGTFGGNEGVAPIYNKKVGTSAGICIGAVNDFQSNSKFYGISLALGDYGGGIVNGINIGLANIPSDFENKTIGRVNGLEIGLLNLPKSGDGIPVEINGLQIGAMNYSTKINGLQIGIVNIADGGKIGQIGIFNSIESEEGVFKKMGIGINYHF